MQAKLKDKSPIPLAMAPKILSFVLFVALSMKASSTPLHDGVLNKRAYTCPEMITSPKLGEFDLVQEDITQTQGEGDILGCLCVISISATTRRAELDLL